ncbi:hypothetical protein LguiB_026894 [Lonicera macranthoides]
MILHKYGGIKYMFEIKIDFHYFFFCWLVDGFEMNLIISYTAQLLAYGLVT